MTAEDAARARALDGSAGDADYGVIGTTYDNYRVPDPRIALAVLEALDDSQTVLNVGAGAGSYEPLDRNVTAVEPSASMRSLRPRSLPPALDAVAEKLPFADDSFEASMTTFSVHQWGQPRRRPQRDATRDAWAGCHPDLRSGFTAQVLVDGIRAGSHRHRTAPLSIDRGAS